MYEIKIQTKTLEEANEILKVIDREESEGSLLNFDFTAYSPANIETCERCGTIIEEDTTEWYEAHDEEYDHEHQVWERWKQQK